jgi:hypothetical protein
VRIRRDETGGIDRFANESAQPFGREIARRERGLRTAVEHA